MAEKGFALAVTYDEVLDAYAAALERGVETLTDAEKTQAFLAAVLDGQRVEPFATFLDDGDAALKRLGIQAKTLNETVRDGG